MRSKFCLFTAILLIICIILCGCGKEENAAATETPDNNISAGDPIIATLKPTEEPDDISATSEPASSYVDLIDGSGHLTFAASSTEAEGTESALGPELAFDGDSDTRWSSVFYDVEGCWICVQFGYPVIINGVWIDENQTWGQMQDWEAQYYSEEKGDWVTAYSDFTAVPGEYYSFDKNTEETYAFRLYFLSGTGITITINDIGLEGLFADVPEGTSPRQPMDLLKPPSEIPDGAQQLSGDWLYDASSSEEANGEVSLPPEYSFDGDPSTRWSSQFGDLYGAWISVDFQTEVTVSGFVVNEATNWGYVTSYSVQIMEDGAWNTVYNGEKFVYNEYVALPSPVSASQLRFLFNDGETLSETVTIWEILLYN